MKSLTRVLTIASTLVVLLAVASAFGPLEDDDLAAAQEMYMEYPELAQFFPEYKRAKMTGFNAIDTLKMMRARENIRKAIKSQAGRRRRLADTQ